MIKLYYAPGTCSLACWIALDWVGADYSVVKVDPASGDYKKINPLGTVPAIDIGARRPFNQADAILKYIVNRYPDKNLGAAEGAEALLEFDELLAFLSGDFHPAFWPFFTPQRFTTSDSEEALQAVRAASYERVDRVMRHLDGLLDGCEHLYRSRRTVADSYAFVMTRWTSRFPKAWKDYPNVRRFMQTMSKDESVQRVLEASAA